MAKEGGKPVLQRYLSRLESWNAFWQQVNALGPLAYKSARLWSFEILTERSDV